MGLERRVTRADVARRAGASTAVVSYVINNGPRPVAAETRARVMRAIEELGYRPDAAAQALSGGRTRMLGLVVPDIRTPLFASIVAEIEAQAAVHEHLVLVGNNFDEEREHRYLRELVALRARGIILISQRAPKQIVRDARNAEARVVLFLREISSANASAVVSNYLEQAFLATMHLSDHGYESVGMISMSPGSRGKFDVISQMIEGWRRACRQLDMGADAAPLVVAHHEAEFAVDTIERALARSPVRAVLVSNAGQTEATYAAARRLGMRIPDDLAVIALQPADSFLYEPRPAQWTLDLATMSRLATDEAIKLTSAPTARHVVDGRFVPGPSCGCHS